MNSYKFRFLKKIFFLLIFYFSTVAAATEFSQQSGDFDYNYIFEQGSIWIDKDIITKKDPSSFISLEFIEEKQIEWWDQRTWKVNVKQYENINQKIFFNVFIFRAFFEKSHDINIFEPNFLHTDSTYSKMDIFDMYCGGAFYKIKYIYMI